MFELIIVVFIIACLFAAPCIN